MDDKQEKKFLEPITTTTTLWFILQAAAQGIIGWIAARYFSKWWISHIEKEKTNGVVKGVSQEE